MGGSSSASTDTKPIVLEKRECKVLMLTLAINSELSVNALREKIQNVWRENYREEQEQDDNFSSPSRGDITDTYLQAGAKKDLDVELLPSICFFSTTSKKSCGCSTKLNSNYSSQISTPFSDCEINKFSIRKEMDQSQDVEEEEESTLGPTRLFSTIDDVLPPQTASSLELSVRSSFTRKGLCRERMDSLFYRRRKYSTGPSIIEVPTPIILANHHNS